MYIIQTVSIPPTSSELPSGGNIAWHPLQLEKLPQGQFLYPMLSCTQFFGLMSPLKYSSKKNH